MRNTAAILAFCACSAEAFSPSSMRAFSKPIALGGLALRSSHCSMPTMSAAERGPSPLLMSSAIIEAPTTQAPATTVPTPSSVAASPPTPVMGFLPPPALYAAMANVGAAKAVMPWWKILFLGILAGVYIGFGSCLAVSVGGACGGMAAAGNLGAQKIMMGAFGLPFGLLMVTIGGAELFTGNTAALTAAVAENKASLPQLVKNWCWSYLGNLIGSVLLAVIVFHSGALAAPSMATAKLMAVSKTSLAFGPAFLRGILCNWLVCMGVWQAAGAQDVASKALAIWFPISAFVAMGFEHSVANMFFLPIGMMLGADVTWKAIFLSNLLPVTLGNMFAGALLVAGSYSLAYGTPGNNLKKILG